MVWSVFNPQGFNKEQRSVLVSWRKDGSHTRHEASLAGKILHAPIKIGLLQIQCSVPYAVLGCSFGRRWRLSLEGGS